MVAPIWHRIELQAVRELHLLGFAKLLELLPSLALSLALLCLYWVASRKFVELEGWVDRAVTKGCKAVQGGNWVRNRKKRVYVEHEGAGKATAGDALGQVRERLRRAAKNDYGCL